MVVRTSFFLLSCLLLFHIWSHAQNIKGVIYDENNEEIIPYVNILIKDSSKGTISGPNGTFSINLENLEAEEIQLSFSSMGYQTFQQVLKMPIDTDSLLKIYLKPSEITLDEVVITPLDAEEYIRRVVQKIPHNYPDSAFICTGYFNEYLKENKVYLKFSEGLMEIWHPAYHDTTSTKVRILNAREKTDLGHLTFMRKKWDKMYDKGVKKEKKKALKEGTEWKDEEHQSIDQELLTSSLGGPNIVTFIDPIYNMDEYLQEKHFKDFDYEISRQTEYQGKKVMVISFKSKRKLKYIRGQGEIFIDTDHDVIVAIKAKGNFHVPAMAKPVLFVMGIKIENVAIEKKVHYRNFNGNFYLSDFETKVQLDVVNLKMFSKNIPAQFEIEQHYFVSTIEKKENPSFPKSQWMDMGKSMQSQAVFPYDENLWKAYEDLRP